MPKALPPLPDEDLTLAQMLERGYNKVTLAKWRAKGRGPSYYLTQPHGAGPGNPTLRYNRQDLERYERLMEQVVSYHPNITRTKVLP